MRWMDVSFRSPAENLAFDEVLLDGADAGRSGETLRFWESPVRFVVLGAAQTLRQEVREKACQEDRVPVFRRCSGGGCVLQGPGCLNYSLVLRYDDRPDTRTIRGSYCHILDRISAAFQQHGLHVRPNGVSDLSLRGRKVSGNAQRRRKYAFLHHGTLLYDMDPEAMERYLCEPPPEDRPQYRGDRTHRGFVTQLPFSPEALIGIIREAFEMDGSPQLPRPWELRTARALAYAKYHSEQWTRRR